MKIKMNYEDYSEREFLELVTKVFNADFLTEVDADKAVFELVRLSEHPSGADIVFYPSADADDSPEGILNVIKEWRAMNGKPGFKRP
ncbi:bacteriocin immunity protein [Acerihabitans sp. TG2]|uniref:bacteriocin immunity protein n=1 Tax=Acerihabitans sp. TG2 TaxID=3096008 RepID=UPI002B23BB14|nr:bacteriocin immunity protein [Acerihabitans sp. TG2]MEA9390696.1 bacteriocin immunity protein [Acerihabitans sp. TG2]